jgi:dephospho-CoA kinase
MLKVGLTGNIGSGKTVIARIFSSLGVPVFHADLEARKQYEKENVISAVREKFGPTVFSQSGELLRPALAEIVFNNPVLLEELNRIIHPGVRKDYLEWCEKQVGASYSLYEAAILFESGHYKEMDRVICVTAPEELRIRRVMERDYITRDEVMRRIANQWEDARKAALADFVINNDETGMVIEQVLEIHGKLIRNSKFKIQNSKLN